MARISSAARQTVSGYLPYAVDRPGIEPGSPPRQGGIVPFDFQPISQVDLIGVEPITRILQGSIASIGMQAHIRSQESADRELLLSPDNRLLVEGPSGN